ncbi:MAG TPA: hypothetical protein VHN18_15255 [Micromonosporaceae bacterium]|nr:hypothetical protein [Micromonosporaceae bacterium]
MSAGRRRPCSTFTDAKGWAPGLEFRGDAGYFFRDIDASIVIPARNNASYTTRIVNPDGTPATDHYGLDFGFTVTGTGNPEPSYGVTIAIEQTAKDNSYATVHVTPATP